MQLYDNTKAFQIKIETWEMQLKIRKVIYLNYANHLFCASQMYGSVDTQKKVYY
jgi:hypothetical protein